MNAAELVVEAARELELQERWDEALSKYLLAIESVMRILASENRGTRRAVALQRKVSNWLTSAERIKAGFFMALPSHNNKFLMFSVRKNLTTIA